MTRPATSPTEPTEFLRWWISHHIGAGSQLSDAAVLAEALSDDAKRVGIEYDALEAAAGKPIRQVVEAATKRAIEEGLL